MRKIVITVIGATLAWIAARVIGPPFMEVWGDELQADVKELLLGTRDAPWGAGWAWAIGSVSLALALATAITAGQPQLRCSGAAGPFRASSAAP